MTSDGSTESYTASAEQGNMAFNTTDNKVWIFDGTDWIDLTGSGTGGGRTQTEVATQIRAAAGNGLVSTGTGTTATLAIDLAEDSSSNNISGLGFNAAGDLRANTGQGLEIKQGAVNSEITLSLYSRKTDLFLGTEGTSSTNFLTVGGTQTMVPFTPYTTNGVVYRFYDGVEIDSAGTITTGDGFWTTDLTGSPTAANSANLIG